MKVLEVSKWPSEEQHWQTVAALCGQATASSEVSIQRENSQRNCQDLHLQTGRSTENRENKLND
jgi:hypothetical protein